MWKEQALADPKTRAIAGKLAGYSDAVINDMVLNPEQPTGGIDIYTEKFIQRTLPNGIVVGGTADLIFDGMLGDTKTTSVYTYMHGYKDNDYILQLSIYRWILENSDIDIADQGFIDYEFTDFKLSESYKTNYPPAPSTTVTFNLMPYDEVEHFIMNKINEVARISQLDDHELPDCSEEFLRTPPPTFKYYAKKASFEEGKASQKNFDDEYIGASHWQDKGKGVLVRVEGGEPSACKFCSMKTVCNQYKDFENVTSTIIRDFDN